MENRILHTEESSWFWTQTQFLTCVLRLHNCWTCFILLWSSLIKQSALIERLISRVSELFVCAEFKKPSVCLNNISISQRRLYIPSWSEWLSLSLSVWNNNNIEELLCSLIQLHRDNKDSRHLELYKMNLLEPLNLVIAWFSWSRIPLFSPVCFRRFFSCC